MINLFSCLDRLCNLCNLSKKDNLTQTGDIFWNSKTITFLSSHGKAKSSPHFGNLTTCPLSSTKPFLLTIKWTHYTLHIHIHVYTYNSQHFTCMCMHTHVQIYIAKVIIHCFDLSSLAFSTFFIIK